jgi:hypothetical protein
VLVYDIKGVIPIIEIELTIAFQTEVKLDVCAVNVFGKLLILRRVIPQIHDYKILVYCNAFVCDFERHFTIC